MAISDQESIEEFRKLKGERDRIEGLIDKGDEPDQIKEWQRQLRHLNQAIADHMDLPPYEND